MVRNIVVGSFAALLAIAGASPTLAISGKDSAEQEDNSGSSKIEPMVRQRVSETETGVRKVVEDTVKSDENEDKQRVQSKTNDLRRELGQLKQQSKQKLEGRRLAQCENRQASINKLLTSSVTVGRARLAAIERVDQNVRTFAEKKKLMNDDVVAAEKAADEQKASAVSTLATMSASTFSCDTVDGAKPSEAIKTMKDTKHATLDSYRASVSTLITTVKASFAASQSAKASGEES